MHMGQVAAESSLPLPQFSHPVSTGKSASRTSLAPAPHRHHTAPHCTALHRTANRTALTMSFAGASAFREHIVGARLSVWRPLTPHSFTPHHRAESSTSLAQVCSFCVGVSLFGARFVTALSPPHEPAFRFGALSLSLLRHTTGRCRLFCAGMLHLLERQCSMVSVEFACFVCFFSCFCL